MFHIYALDHSSELLGKSTLLGVLTQGELDNGRGSARLNMFRHRHEIQSGRTSCISHEALGFDTQGNVINQAALDIMTAEEVSEKSSKLVTFMDLAGHRRYLKTTIQALTGYSPHFSIVVVSAEGINSMTLEHLDLIQKALDISYFIVVTKCEMRNATDATVTKLKSVLASIERRKRPFLIRSNDDVITAAARKFPKQIVPIFCVSSVTGEGLDLLTRFLFLLSPGISNAEKERLEQEPSEFIVDEIFKIPGVGSVVGGLLVKGVLTEDTAMRIGPLQDGSFYPVNVQSIHRNRAPCRVVRAGQSASLAFSHDSDLPVLRSGMILISLKDIDLVEPYGSWFFQVCVPCKNCISASYFNETVCQTSHFHFHSNLFFQLTRQKCRFCFMRLQFTRVFKQLCTSEAYVKRLLSKVSWAAEKSKQTSKPPYCFDSCVIRSMLYLVNGFYSEKERTKASAS